MLTACTAPDALPATAQLQAPESATTVLSEADPVGLAVGTSAALFTSAPVAAVALESAPDTTSAEQQRLPLLLLGPDVEQEHAVVAELDRLGAQTVLATDGAAAKRASAWDGVDVVEDPADLPDRADPAPPPDLTVLATDGDSAAAATARAAGLAVTVVPDGDPRAVDELRGADRPERVLALGPEFGDPQRLDGHLATAAAGTELPGGGQLLFPGRYMIALYGHPGVAALGVLGEQPVDAAIQRAQAVAQEYEAHVDEPVVPAFEIISTVADTTPGPDGAYSSAADPEFLRPWVDAAADAGVYVVLDLQPGRTDFLSQAMLYEELLAEPHVGLALDPEWRLEPDQLPLRQIGSVGMDEVNAVSTWLADLTRDNALPQKLLLLHQFRIDMLPDRERLDTSRDELSYMIHADGFGDPEQKLETWTTLRADAPDDVVWGWKNFYDEDSPTFTPEQTMGVQPEPPVFVSYQ